MRQVANVVVAKRKNEYGEYVVRAYDQRGARYPQADYFTEYRADAYQTAAAMLACSAARAARTDAAELGK